MYRRVSMLIGDRRNRDHAFGEERPGLDRANGLAFVDHQEATSTDAPRGGTKGSRSRTGVSPAAMSVDPVRHQKGGPS
jgi:hypothetical protein